MAAMRWLILVLLSVVMPIESSLADEGSAEAGGLHTCALHENGNVSCWGDNSSGQLGIGTYSGSFAIPVTVPGLSNVTALAVSYDHACALRADTTVACWGDNSTGQLGDGTTISRPLPTTIPNFSGVAALSAGGSFTCALKTDGTVWCWGLNGDGNLGLGDFDDRHSPARLSGLDNVASIAAGHGHACAVGHAGGLSCWGANDYGQLAIGDTTNRALPVIVPTSGLAVHALALGYGHTCAVMGVDRQISCAGLNDEGQLGDGSTVDHLTLQEIMSANVRSIAAGYYHTCAVDDTGAVTCWGYNRYGQLGVGNNTRYITPMEVSLAQPVARITTRSTHTCADTVGGRVMCWGSNTHGQLGLGSVGYLGKSAKKIPNAGNFTHLAAGGSSVCGLRNSANSIWCWGDGTSGQLGFGYADDFTAPAYQFNGPTGALRLAMGSTSACAILGGRTLNCWGANFAGQLGTGDYDDRWLPAYVVNLLDVTDVAVGYAHACAVKLAGQVACWGVNWRGQLGLGDEVVRTAPAFIPNFTAAHITAGELHTCALQNSGELFCWGYNGQGQLGLGTADVITHATPESVSMLSGVYRVSAGALHTCAIRNVDRSVWCWGSNALGQSSGSGSPAVIPAPTPVPGLSGMFAVAAGRTHSCALKETGGTVICWGSNSRGQLGQGDTVQYSTPVTVPGLSGVSELVVGDAFTCARVFNTDVYCWGDGYRGQLGQGVLGYAREPAYITDYLFVDSFDS